MTEEKAWQAVKSGEHSRYRGGRKKREREVREGGRGISNLKLRNPVQRVEVEDVQRFKKGAIQASRKKES